jgi:uncharacterized protein
MSFSTRSGVVKNYLRQETSIEEITDATARIAQTDFGLHLDELESLRLKYSKESWFSKIEGQYTGELLRGEIRRAQSESPSVPWHYPALAVLRRVHCSKLWVFAKDDSVAPSSPSIERLKRLKRSGVRVDSVLFANADHGINTFLVRPDGTRQNTGVADGYLKLLADWAKNSLTLPTAQRLMNRQTA